MPEPFVVSGVRTPIRRYGGALAHVRPDDLAALVAGASGARILVTLLGRLGRSGGRRGLATMCAGAGQGGAPLVERP
ncbi:hypothetical protein [Nonomuraea jabiensis]|uniref:hypothetical protein n=1 Tax=Nonomuraea jabiensis TaxID=882448 RepID=UPI0036B58F68